MDEKSIFIEALQREDPAERAAYLDAACADQPELRQRIEALLRRHDDAGSFLEKPPVEYLTPETVLAPDSHRPDIYGMAQPAAGRAPGEEPDLGFLDPCDKPDTLGQFGSYEILEILGAGGMGVVLKARDPRLNRILAIKVLAPQFAANVMGRKRFLREGRAAAAISHDHVVSIHGISESEHLPFLMMEYVDGLSLQQRIDRDGPLELKEILRIGKQAALGVAAAHAQGLIHRDIKPSNILLENSVERVRITDFGLARAVDDVSITRTGVITGTPQYMSPEQAQNEPVDHRSDLFSLGSVLYAMCTGRSPFRGDSMVTVIRRVCDDEPRLIREVNPDIPEWLVAIIDRLLAKDPDERFQTVSEVAELLGQHLAHLQHPSVNPMPTAPQWRSGRSGKASRGNPWAMVAAMLSLLVGGLGLTEATGVTELAGTVIEIFTPRGTLIVEVDDPGMSVTVDQGGEEVTVSDGTHHVLTLRPGEVEVRAEKDGKEIDRQLATITRGGRRVVTIAISEPPPPPLPRDPSTETVNPAPLPGTPRLLADVQYAHRHMGFDVSPDGQRIICSTPWGKVAVWDTSSGLELMSLEGHARLVESVAYAPNGRLFASGGEDGTVKVWDAHSGEERLTLEGHAGHVRCLCFSPNSRWLATSGRDDRTIKLWDAGTGRLHHTFNHLNYVADLAFDADGRRVAAGGRINPIKPGGPEALRPCLIKVWDVGTGEEFNAPHFGSDGTNMTRFSPDGKLIATCGIAQVRVWDSKTGSLRFVAKHRIHYGADVFSVSFSPDSRRLATAGANNEVVIWDTANGRELMALPHPQRLNHAIYSPDGNWLAACTRNGILKLWHTTSGQCHLTLQEHIGDFRARFTPDGRRLISAGNDGTLKVWDVSGITGDTERQGVGAAGGPGPPLQKTVHTFPPITPSNAGQLRELWKKRHRSSVRGSVAVVGNTAYYGDYGNAGRGTFYAVNAATGQEIWSRQLAGKCQGHVINGKTAYVSSLRSVVAFHAASGEPLWTSTPWAGNVGGLVAADDILYVRASDPPNLWALDAETGDSLWHCPKGDVVVSDDTLYRLTAGTLYAQDARTGEPLWQVAAEEGEMGSPAVMNDVVYGHTTAGKLCAFDATDPTSRERSHLWVGTTEINEAGHGPQSPAVGDGKVFVGAGSTFYAFDTAPTNESEKQPVWTTTVDAPFFSTSAPRFANGVVYSTAGNHFIYAFDANTGAVLWSHRSDGTDYPMRSTPTIANGRLYHLATFDFTLYAFHVPVSADSAPTTEHPSAVKAPASGKE